MKANFWNQFKRENIFPASVDVVSKLSCPSTYGGHVNFDSKKRKRGRPPKSQTPRSEQKKSKLCETNSIEEGTLSTTCNREEAPTHRIEPFKRPPPPMSALELFNESPRIRRKIMDEIPGELHHDEVFVDERIRQMWIEMQSIDKSRNGDAIDGNMRISGNSFSIDDSNSIHPANLVESMMTNDKATSDTENSASKLDDISSLSHWKRMEKEEFERFEKETHEYQSAFNTNRDDEESKPSVAKAFAVTCSAQSNTKRKKNGQNLNGSKCNTLSLRQTAALMDPVIRRKKLLELQERDAPAEILSRYFPRDDSPIRQYFHSRNNLPISRSEWEVDSDDEPDDDWLHQMHAKLIEEFEDVSQKEKRFMNLWNVFIKSHCVIADRDIPGKCKEFIRKYKKHIIDEGLRTNVLLHLFNLWDDGVMSSGNILVCMSFLGG
ncbi:hypothetical protein ACHAXS_011204 [Conticribra weissflogii]